MKLQRNWEIKTGLVERAVNQFKKGGFNPAYYLYRYRFNSYPEKFKIWKYPIDVIAEASNLCNLRCTMCFQTDSVLNVTKTTSTGFMEMGLFRKIADEVARCGIPALKLSWRGEPMLNPDFTEMIRYAKSKRILEVTSLTNATLMDEKVSREIVSAGLDQLIISIDGFSKTTYEKIRVGADYDIVTSNIRRLVELKGRSVKPFIRLQYTESDINRHETSAFYDYWKNRVDEITISYCQDFGSPVKNDGEKTPVYDFCCKQPFQRLVIMADGNVCVCATDVTGSISIGNVRESSISDLWHCSKIEELRLQHKSARYSENPMCRICAHNVFKANKSAGRLKS